jgi:thiol-disulfide isomerase/thioredoxin
MTPLATSADKPVATLDIAAKRGTAWPVRVVVENGIPENVQVVVSAMEVEDDAIRKKVVNREGVSFQVSPNQAISHLDKDGRGALTQCGKSGKLVVGAVVTGSIQLEVSGLATEFVVDPGFDLTKVKSVTAISGTDKFEMIDGNGAKATIGKAEVSLTNGRPLITFHLRRNKHSIQEFTGLVADSSGSPISDVRVGTAIGFATGSSEWPTVANTDGDGRFRLQVPLPDSGEKIHLKLILNKDGYAGYDSREFPLPKQPGKAVDLGKFPLQVGHSLPVLVVDARDVPLSGVVIEPQSDYALRRQAIRTDAHGRGVLKNLPDGLLQAQITHQDRNERCQLIVSAVDAENTEAKLRIKAATPLPTANTKSPEPIEIGQTAPELVIEAWTDGKQHRLADYRGRIVVLDFWGTWCSPCVASIPVMQELADRYEARGVVFLGIHTPDGELDQINKLKKIKGWKTATGVDRGTTISDGASSQSYGVRGYPSIIVIDTEGKIAFNSGIQPKDIDAFMKEMQQLAESLQIPWPLPEKVDEESISLMNRLTAAKLSQQYRRSDRGWYSLAKGVIDYW